jgi:hypothetical protein
VNRLQNNRLQSLFELIHRLVPNDDEEDNDGDGDKMHSSDTENNEQLHRASIMNTFDYYLLI